MHLRRLHPTNSGLPRAHGPALLIAAITSFCGLALPAWANPAQEQGVTAEQDAVAVEDLKVILLSELTIQALGPVFSDLTQGLYNLELPEASGREHFQPEVTFTDLDAPDDGYSAPKAFAGGLVQKQYWPIAGKYHSEKNSDVSLWKPFLSSVDFFEHAKVYPIRGVFLDERRHVYETLVGISANARMADGKRVSVEAKQIVTWVRTGGGKLKDAITPKKFAAPAQNAKKSTGEAESKWKIRSWHMKKFKVMTTDDLLFEETTASALHDPALYTLARHSIHVEKILEYYYNDDLDPPSEFEPVAQDRHPGLSVVDIDGDGFDDLYLMARWGPNMLFHNMGDGTFEEVAKDWGLDFDGGSSSAIFADFDNDGDPDLALGRTLTPSMILFNENGRFVDRSSDVEGRLPALVSSVSAGDFDGDGLLDVYFSTYAAGRINRNVGVGNDQLWDAGTLEFPDGPVLKEWLSEKDAETLTDKYRGAGNALLDRHGPPNAMLHNTGGGSFRVMEDEVFKVFRNTYQSTWADYDNDGDQDIYIANDFAPNYMLRNDGGVFVDATDATNSRDSGFGMGASWGDYDQDGKLDLYVSNMYSKAGQRILAQAGGINPNLERGTRGNTLFRNTGNSLEVISGSGKDEQEVEKAGWSWGSQFVDFNNDGNLDIHAPCGFYSAPPRIATKVDL